MTRPVLSSVLFQNNTSHTLVGNKFTYFLIFVSIVKHKIKLNYKF